VDTSTGPKTLVGAIEADKAARMGFRRQTVRVGLVVLAIAAASCASPSPRGPRSAATTESSTSAPPASTTTTLPTERLGAIVTVSPDQGVAGTSFTFSVVIRGPGTLDSEAVQFGDGSTSGANAGVITCGQTARADHTSTYPHTYTQPGAFRFTNDITVLSPPPSCRHEQITAPYDLVVAAPLAGTTLNGAFLSPTKNIACSISALGQDVVRCATFSPPSLVTMDASGALQTCTGGQCNLGNPAQDTPVLPYGAATGDATFQCLSKPAGMTCTIVGHIGFTISRAGVQSVR
jgi:hypothetical protein